MSFAITQEAKHGSICLSLPHQPFEVDITVFVDVEQNPGPSTALGLNVLENLETLTRPLRMFGQRLFILDWIYFL